MSDKLTVNEWKQQISNGEKYRAEYGRDKDWAENTNRYRGIHPSGEYPYDLIYGVARALVPSLYFRMPYVNFIPTGAGVDTEVKVRQHVANWVLREMQCKTEGKYMVLDAYLYGNTIAQLGMGMSSTIPRKKRFSLLPSFTKTDRKYDYDINKREAMPWMSRVSPACIVVPWGVTKLSDTPWVAKFMVKRTADVKLDERFDKKVRDALVGNYISAINSQARADLFKWIGKDVKGEWTGMWEIYDYTTDEFSVVCEDIDQWLLPPTKSMLGIQGVPYAGFSFNEYGDSFWCTSDASYIMPQQEEMNEIRTQMVHHRRIALLKFLIKRGALKEADLSNLMSGKVGAAAFVDLMSNESMNNIVTTFQPHIPPDLIAMGNLVRSDVYEKVGFSRNQLGQFDTGSQGGSSRRTATEANLVQSANSIRMSERSDAIADFWLDVTDKVMDMIDTNWTAEQVIDVIGQDGFRYWVRYNVKELTNDYRSRIDVENMTPITQRLKRQELIQLIQGLGKMPGVNVNYLIQMLAREFDYLDIKQIFPQAQQNAAMSMQQFNRQEATAGSREIPVKQIAAGASAMPEGQEYANL